MMFNALRLNIPRIEAEKELMSFRCQQDMNSKRVFQLTLLSTDDETLARRSEAWSSFSDKGT